MDLDTPTVFTLFPLQPWSLANPLQALCILSSRFIISTYSSQFCASSCLGNITKIPRMLLSEVPQATAGPIQRCEDILRIDKVHAGKNWLACLVNNNFDFKNRTKTHNQGRFCDFILRGIHYRFWIPILLLSLIGITIN